MLYLLVLVVGAVVGVLLADKVEPKIVAVYNAIKTALKG